jgi:hypothetical protein
VSRQGEKIAPIPECSVTGLVVYRDDRANDRDQVSFDGDLWLGYVPIRMSDTICVQDRLPAEAAAVLINPTHTYRDVFLPRGTTGKSSGSTLLMGTVDEEAKRFWPVYDSYMAERGKFFDARLALIMDYSDNFDRMTDAKEQELLNRRVEQLKLRDKLDERYRLQFATALSPGGSSASTRFTGARGND